jgi:hypothetical protein
VSAHTVVVPGKLKVIDHPIGESVTVAQSSATESQLYSALFCVFMAPVRYSLEQRVFIYDCYVKKKTRTNLAGENFAVNFPTKYVHLEIQLRNL